MQEPGACFDLGVGEACTDNGQCLSGHCVDGVCCETACDGICESCLASKTGGTNGSCDPAPNGADPDLECSGSFGCSGSRACISGAANGVACGQDGQCESGHCVDGVCCAAACGGTCEACTAELNLGAAADGTCAPIPYLEDPETECAGGFGCSGGSACNPEKTWQGAVLVETENAGGASYPQVVLDDTGNAIAVWRQYDGMANSIWANRKPAGQAWGQAAPIELSSAGVQSPMVAATPDGGAIAVWAQPVPDGGSRVWSSHYPVGDERWSNPTLLETEYRSSQSPQLGVDSAGNAIAVWTHNAATGAKWNVRANRYIAGQGWGASVFVEPADASQRDIVRLAVANNGVAMAVWNRWSGTEFNVWASRYDPGSDDWSTPVKVAAEAHAPGVAACGLGAFVVVYDYLPGGSGYSSVWSRRFQSDAWGGAVPIAGEESVVMTSPSIGCDSGGNAIVTWAQYDGTHYNLWMSRSPSGSTWETPRLFENVAGTDVPVHFDPMGNAFITWSKKSGETRDVWVSRNVRGTGWDTPALLDTGNENAEPHDLAVAADGSAVVIWSQSDGTRSNIYANSFE